MLQKEPGLSTIDALRILHSDLQDELKRYKVAQHSLSLTDRLRRCFLHHNNVESVLHWTSLVPLSLCILLLLAAFTLHETNFIWLAIQSFVILMIVVVTVYLLAQDDRLQHDEVYLKTQRVLDRLEECIKDDLWSPSDFVSLHAPLSPCVSLQWTARDGGLINLPCALLVEGDIVYLRPGQLVLMDCQQLHGSTCYAAGDLYNPVQDGDGPQQSCRPHARTPSKPAPFVVKETPIVRNLRLLLEEGRRRPSSMLNNERYQTCTVWVERRVLVIVFAVSLLTNILRYIFLRKHLGHWAEVFLSLQVQAMLPLTALIYPLLWKLIDMYGTARLISLFQKSKDLQLMHSSGFESSSTLEGAAYVIQDNADIFKRLLEVIQGQSDVLPRTSNFLHGLGNVTSFCCVDKKGVLSWPNPTVEKVFFLTSTSLEISKCSYDHDDSDSSTSLDSDSNDAESERDEPDSDKVFIENADVSMSRPELNYFRTNFQVLDVTQDAQNHFTFNFDDPNWKRYITCLKPLGLNILLNTCSSNITEKYTQFADHVTCSSHKHEVSVPVVNRRCFCELARQIGFNETATNIFTTQRVLALMRHITPESIALDSFIKARVNLKHKMPMPHVFSVVVKETNSGTHQLFSQGTGDLLLDACSEFWNGVDICRLTDVERKKISDFYHRTSMSSYCTAFSYCPVSHPVGEDHSDLYVEVPEDAEDLFPSLRSPEPSRSWDTQSLDSRFHTCPLNLSQSSFDSSVTESTSTSHPTSSVLSTFREQCNQIFIGMISMQYQAKQDVIDLIENLESACIRFVHFSKENELRSRVFSEKMGLEAGWNCHISLLGEGSRDHGNVSPSNHDVSQSSSNHVSRYSSRRSTDSGPLFKASRDNVLMRVKASQDSLRGRRSSAPGAINLDTTQVKFETTSATDTDSTNKVFPDISCTENRMNQVQHTPYQQSSAVKLPKKLYRGISLQDHHHYELVPSHTEPAVTNQVGVSPPAVLSERDELEHVERSSGSEVRETDVLLDDAHSPGSVESLPVSSFITENTDSMTGALGLTNRAKLPKGIENIRPHIANVDNVPLLVSLFTDCTPGTTQEMFSILQENGEVVCCLGSSANIHNTAVFLQADCSLSVEPVYPQICMRQPPTDLGTPQDRVTPMQLSALLLSIPCSLSFLRNDNIAVIRLIALARHHCQQMRHMFLFYLLCQLTVSLLQLLASMCLLPPALAPHHTLWLAAVVIPLLSLTVLGNPLDLQIVKMAQGKNMNHLRSSSIVDFVKYYLIRYLPSILVCLVCHCMTLNAFCLKVTARSSQGHNTTTSCHFLYGDTGYQNASQWNGWYREHYSGLVISQNLLAFQLVLYMCCGSLCFVYRLKQLWQEPPFTNRVWCVVTPLVLLCQVIYLTVDVTLATGGGSSGLSIDDVPIATWVLGLVWPLVLIPVHELAKRREAKTWRRYQKRARLDFGTKLGMNSPF